MKNKKVLLATSLFLLAFPALAQVKKPIVIAVIDTGLSEEYMAKPYICKFGHKDFSGTGLNDRHGHGTHISGLIQQSAISGNVVSASELNKTLDTKANYCQVILKYYDPTAKFNNNLKNEIDALQYAINIKVDMINFSGGGEEFSKEEQVLIKKALDMGIKIVVAAGNEKSDITKKPFYPACDDPRLTIVGNMGRNKQRLPSSNYGDKVNTWEVGEDVYSSLPHGSGVMTGTSQSTAIKSGKMIHEMLSH
jgi:subtilisin family serine protease